MRWLLVALLLARPLAAAAEVDIGELVRAYERAASASHAQVETAAFVSFSMPATSLRQLARDSVRAQVPLVLRGLVDGSVAKTVARIREIDATGQSTWLIDPRLYRRFEVRSVPQFVVYAAGRHDRARGDVSLGYAMALLARGSGLLAVHAGRVAARLDRRR